MFPEYKHRIFFETNEENVKKLGEILKKYIKKNKKYIHKVDDIEDFVKL